MEKHEIKFRAWGSDGDVGPKMWASEHVLQYFDLWLADDNAVLMLYAGLKDDTKWEELTGEEQYRWVNDGNLPAEWSGKDIYDGDIVYHETASPDDPAQGYGDHFEVRFIGGCFKLCNLWREELLRDYYKVVKVVGNIFEGTGVV